MTMIDWKAKLSSRKFWTLLVGLATGLLLLFGVDRTEVEQIGGIILAAGSIIAYILGESLADAAGAANAVWVPGDADEYEPPDWEKAESGTPDGEQN